ncbi:MAG: response regulator transcription factor [Gammaproteobacteria bacterium]|nr:response regulator transcription factor [Gammaproteobacteria bacterium]
MSFSDYPDMRAGAAAAPTVYVVDSDPVVRASMVALVRAAAWRAETFASAEDFLARPRLLAPGCLVLEVVLPNLSGLELQRLVAERVEMPIIFVTGCRDVSTTVRAMKGGALEFLTKPCRDDVLASVIRHAVDLSHALLKRELDGVALHARHASLSPRERQVMALVVCGRLNKQVAAELGISEITVKAHRGKMMRKMQAGSLADLVNMAVRLRLPLLSMRRPLVSTAHSVPAPG